MMKHAVIIIADKDITHLKRLIAYFDERFEIYIAIDKKSPIDVSELVYLPNVKNVAKKYNVNWGGWNMVQYTIDFIKMLGDIDYIEYVHLISGSDYPIKSINHLYNYFTQNKNKDYISYEKLPVKWNEWGGDGGYDRLQYVYLMDVFNVRRKLGRIMTYGLVKVQKLLRLKRSIYKADIQYCVGSQWWSLSKNTILEVNHYMETHSHIVNSFKRTYIPDEMCIHSIIQTLKNTERLDYKNLRYFDWNIRSDQKTRPAVLNISDFDSLQKTDAFFARKFNSELSAELLDMIDRNLINE